jgi:hypothetical protein
VVIIVTIITVAIITAPARPRVVFAVVAGRSMAPERAAGYTGSSQGRPCGK